MDGRKAPDAAAVAGPAMALRIEFRASGPGEPVSGLVAVDGSARPTAFCGWAELLAVLTEVRADARPTTGS